MYFTDYADEALMEVAKSAAVGADGAFAQRTVQWWRQPAVWAAWCGTRSTESGGDISLGALITNSKGVLRRRP